MEQGMVLVNDEIFSGELKHISWWDVILMWMQLISTWLSCPSYSGNPKTLVFSMPLFDLHPEVCSFSTPWVVQVSNFELAKFWLGTLIQTYFATCLPIACQMMVKYVPPTRKKHRTANSTIGIYWSYFPIFWNMFLYFLQFILPWSLEPPAGAAGHLSNHRVAQQVLGPRGSDGRSVRNLESIGGVQSGTEGLNKKMGGWGDRINPQQNYILYLYIYVYIHYCVYHNINIISILLRIICDWLHVRHLCK